MPLDDARYGEAMWKVAWSISHGPWGTFAGVFGKVVDGTNGRFLYRSERCLTKGELVLDTREHSNLNPPQ